jgi:hypothetical protein
MNKYKADESTEGEAARRLAASFVKGAGEEQRQQTPFDEHVVRSK